MQNNLPTGSVTGKDGWDWNKHYGPQAQSDSPRRSFEDTAPEQCCQSPDTAGGQRDCQVREAQLEHTEQRLQYVIDHYERLLAERNRQLERRIDQASRPDERSGLLSRFCRWLGDRS